jgi:hypothetical protein
MRYFFEQVCDELFFATIVFGYADNLDQLEILIDQARSQLDGIHKQMTKQRRGLVLAGAFEPNLRSVEQLEAMPLLSSLSHDLP